MPDYKTMYFQLAAKVADAIDLLIEAQKQGEESYISDNSISFMKKVTGSQRKKKNRRN